MTDTPIPNPYEDQTLPCISCNKELRLGPPSGPNHWSSCNDGLILHAIGNFGCFYDPDDSLEFLRLVLCNNCLRQKSLRVQHIHYSRPHPVVKTQQPFLDTLVEHGTLGPTQAALYGLADQAPG